MKSEQRQDAWGDWFAERRSSCSRFYQSICIPCNMDWYVYHFYRMSPDLNIYLVNQALRVTR